MQNMTAAIAARVTEASYDSLDQPAVVAAKRLVMDDVVALGSVIRTAKIRLD
jgi:hypothetical protein